MSSDSWTSERARIAAIKRGIRAGERPADDPALAEAYRNLHALRLKEQAKKVVAGWPGLSDEQVEDIVAILRAGTGA